MVPAWAPNFEEIPQGPLYWRIAAALVRDIRLGRLSVGQQLPTHRALAHSLGITVNTVSKAYCEAEQHGHIVSRTGRGTFVMDFPEEAAANTTDLPDVINFKINVVTSEPFSVVFNRLLGALSRRGSLHGLMEHHPHPGLPRHRAAGARWIARRGLDAEQDRVILCSGAQDGLLTVLSTITEPGDTVLTEKLNYAGVRYIGSIRQLNLRGVEIDEHGLIPDALEKACKEPNVKAILATPTNHNPTNAVAPLARRKALVEIAGRAGVLLVEDDIFGHMSGDTTSTLTALAPDRCIYVCGTSKSIAAGLRIGYILPPANLVSPIINKLRAVHWTSPALLGEIATLLIESGEADEFTAWHRGEARTRQRLVLEMLKIKGETVLPSYHLWIPLPEPWRATDFAAKLEAQGVLVSSADQFTVDSDSAPDAIRLSYGSVRDRDLLKKGLGIVANTLAGGAHQLNDTQ